MTSSASVSPRCGATSSRSRLAIYEELKKMKEEVEKMKEKVEEFKGKEDEERKRREDVEEEYLSAALTHRTKERVLEKELKMVKRRLEETRMHHFSEAKEKEDQQALQLEEAKQREDQLKQQIEKLKGELEEEKEKVKKAKAEMVQEIRNVEAEMTETSIKFQKNERTWKAEVERLKEELAAARVQGPPDARPSFSPLKSALEIEFDIIERKRNSL